MTLRISLTNQISGFQNSSVKSRGSSVAVIPIPISVLRSAEEIMTMLLEASEEGIGESYDRDSGRIVWTVRYTLEGEEENGSQLTDIDQSQRIQQRQLQHHHHHRVDKKKVQVRLEIQKDDIQAVLPISKVTRASAIDRAT